MSTRPELIVHLEDPDVYIEIVYDKFGQSQLELLSILNVIGTHWNWNITQLENTLRSALS